jgi:Response regulators consisting of a CheY-like receiver domain and a winged-helix DNA-binding domain
MPELPDQPVILLAEDREDDILLIRHAFQKGGIDVPLFVVRDGEETIAYLKGDGKFSNREEYPLPSLLLLDLKMPRMDGFEVLKWIRAQSGLSSLRVVVLTSSERIRDVNIAYNLGANSFLVKPMDFEHVVELTKILKDYWLRLDKPPETFRESRNQKSDPNNKS